MKRYVIHTLGCKVNQCESAAMGCSLEKAGYMEAGEHDGADLVIVNTCAVTGKAAMQSRQVIRQAIRRHPQARIVATGCYAQVGSAEIAAITGVDLIVGHEGKLATDAWLDPMPPSSPRPQILTQRPCGVPTFATLCSAAGEHRTRAFLKIQDGCNTHCTYCIVPIVRGPSRSMPVDDVTAHLNQLGQQDYHEVVLTGIHLGAYGLDLNPRTDLASLLERLLMAASVRRLRLSSIEPTEIDQRLINLMASSAGALCRHWHIPLQSGDDAILKRMGRGYDRQRFAQTVNDIHRLTPRAAIGVDVLVGFPGEDDAAFTHTFELIQSLPVSYLHVFPYSPRPGTRAAGFKNQVPVPVMKDRCRKLRRLGEKKRRQFEAAQLGSYAEVLVESATDKETGKPKGTSDNYLSVILPEAGLMANTLLTVRIERAGPQGPLIGRIASGQHEKALSFDS